MPAIKIHHTATSDASFDGPANKKRLRLGETADYYREAFAWRDPNKDGTTKDSFKFIHHEVNSSGDIGAANIRGCEAGIAVLNGARGGTTIPESDRQGVYNHLAAHLKDANIEPATLKSAEEIEMEHSTPVEDRKSLDFALEVKQLTEDGTFEGMLSVYGVMDLGRDVVEPGAFTKTIAENNGRVPMLWQHKTDEPIGSLSLTDTKEGLKVTGKLDLNVQRAREAYSLIKEDVIRGLSIGYKSIKDKVEGGVRLLKEIKLYEGSVVTFPMLPVAQISAVKAEKGTFQEELQRAQILSARSMAMAALDESLWTTLYDGDARDQIISGSADNIDQFKTAYMELLPKLLDLWQMKEFEPNEGKAGRLSAASLEAIDSAIKSLEALRKRSEAGTSTEAAAADPSEAAISSIEPDAIHSMIRDSVKQFRTSLSLN